MNAIDIADEIYRELDMPEDTSVPAILFWLTSNIGGLNNLIAAEIAVDANGEFVPEIDVYQKAIFKKMFELNYYQRQVKKSLGAAGYSSSIVELREGDRMVRKVSKNEIAKNYLAVTRDLQETLDQMILAYKINRTFPLQVLTYSEEEILGMDPSLVNVNNYRRWYDLE